MFCKLAPATVIKPRSDQCMSCYAADAAEATSIKTVQDMVPAHSSNHLKGSSDANQDALTSAITSDIQTDQQADVHPEPSHHAAAAATTDDAAAGVQVNNSWHQDATNGGRTALAKDLSGDQSTVAAESISPHYSSQQSQGTNIDWEEAAAHTEVSSRQAQPEAQAGSSGAASTQQQGSNAAAQPGTIEHHIANQNMEGYSHFLGKAYQGQLHDDSAKDPKPEPPSSPPKVTSQSSQRARAFANDVKGMAPYPGCSMVGEEGGGRRWLKRAFSMVDQENMGIDMDSQMDSLDKVTPQIPCSISVHVSTVLNLCWESVVSALLHHGQQHARV